MKDHQVANQPYPLEIRCEHLYYLATLKYLTKMFRTGKNMLES